MPLKVQICVYDEDIDDDDSYFWTTEDAESFDPQDLQDALTDAFQQAEQWIWEQKDGEVNALDAYEDKGFVDEEVIFTPSVSNLPVFADLGDLVNVTWTDAANQLVGMQRAINESFMRVFGWSGYDADLPDIGDFTD